MIKGDGHNTIHFDLGLTVLSPKKHRENCENSDIMYLTNTVSFAPKPVKYLG